MLASTQDHLRLLTSCSLIPVVGKHAATAGLILQGKTGQIDWQRITLLGMRHRILPQLYLSLARLQSTGTASIRSQILETFRSFYNRELAHNLRVLELSKRVLDAFANAGLEVVLIKGAAILHYGYPFPNVRAMDDLDLLLRDRAALRSAAQSLLALGFTQGKTSYFFEAGSRADTKFEYVYDDGGPLSVDLHLAIGSRATYLPAAMIWGNAAGGTAGDHEPITSPEDTLLVTCANALANGEFVLRDLLDTVAVLSCRNGEIDWSYLVEQAHAHRLLFPLYSQVILASRFGNVIGMDRMQQRVAALLPKQFQQRLLDADVFDESLLSIPLRWYRDTYFLMPRLGYSYPARHAAAQLREMVQAWVRSGGTVNRLSTYPLWTVERMVQRGSLELRRLLRGKRALG